MDNTLTSDTLVSIIIPAYNAERYIEETIKSALAQTHRNYEIIVVDDGSIDSTVKIVESFGNVIRLYKRENSGVSNARNFAVSVAKGQWIAFLDADDLWEPDKLDTQVRCIDDARWSHTNSLYIGEGQNGCTSRSDLTRQYGGSIYEKLLTSNFITTSTVIMEKALFVEIGGFDESLVALEDWMVWIEASKISRVSYQSEILTKYRVYSGSTSRKAKYMLPLHINVVNRIFSDIPKNSSLYIYKREALLNSYSICSYIAEGSGEYLYSLRYALYSILYAPFSLARWKRLVRSFLNILLKVGNK